MDWLTGWFSEPDKETLEKIHALNRVKLFENARREDLIEVADQATFQKMDVGDLIVEKGDEGDGMYIINEGAVEVVLAAEDDPVATFETGEYFGEMALIEDATRSADVRCQEQGELLFLSKRGFFDLLRGHPKTAGKLLFVLARTLSRRLRETNTQLEQKTDS